MKLKVGDKAPAIELADQGGKIHRLADYAGKSVLAYFYPKDDTPGCTTEACMIRDNWSAFKKIGLTVLGISADSVQRHKKFSEKYKLPFTLLSDEEKKTLHDYDVWGTKKFMGREYQGIFRTSFLINQKGKIVKIYEKVKPGTHATEVVSDVLNFSAAA